MIHDYRDISPKRWAGFACSGDEDYTTYEGATTLYILGSGDMPREGDTIILKTFNNQKEGTFFRVTEVAKHNCHGRPERYPEWGAEIVPETVWEEF